MVTNTSLKMQTRSNKFEHAAINYNNSYHILFQDLANLSNPILNVCVQEVICIDLTYEINI